MRPRAIQAAVSDVLAEIEPMLPPGSTIPVDPEAPLLEADGGPLESLGVVNLMVALERRMSLDFGSSVSLADALAEPAGSSPFRTRKAIEAYMAARLGLVDVPDPERAS